MSEVLEDGGSADRTSAGECANSIVSGGEPNDQTDSARSENSSIAEPVALGVRFPTLSELGYDYVLEDSNGISDKEIGELAREFRVVNVIGDGFVTSEEARIASSRAGFWSTDDEFADALDETDPLGEGLLSFQDFVRLVSLLRRSAITELEVVEAFRSFDRDGRGKLDAADLVNAMTSMGNALLEDEAYQMIHQADPTASGVVDYHSFAKAVFRML